MKKQKSKKYYPTYYDIVFGGWMPQLFFPEIDEEKEDKRINNGVDRLLRGRNSTMRFKKEK